MKLCTEILTHLSLYKKAYHAVFLPVCTKYSLTQIEADILLFLNNNPEYTTATSISSICGLSKPNISTALERLRQRNLLLVEKDANSRRTNRLTLLEEGDHIAEELREKTPRPHPRHAGRAGGRVPFLSLPTRRSCGALP